EPTVEDLLAALAQPHAEVRTRVGPHVLSTTADFSLRPSDGDAPPRSVVDQPVVEPQAVHDALTLRWGTTDPDDWRLSLSQANDHERGRDVIVVGPTVHVRHAHRGWTHYPRDSDLLELWLDDAQRSVHDVIELAAPRLALTAQTIEGAGLAGGPAVEITLALAEATTPTRAAAGPTQAWREGAEIQAVEGSVRLDAAHGIWLHADVSVGYALTGADGRPLAGHVHLQGRVEPGAVEIEAPADSGPLPSRLRYDDEQRQLLDGLAAP
ncbi:MAG: hypothetical protein KDK70_22045, partial [Myxococcales bacterium]|nr:hypothetical protein [Myxococcales bacterium]